MGAGATGRVTETRVGAGATTGAGVRATGGDATGARAVLRVTGVLVRTRRARVDGTVETAWVITRARAGLDRRTL